MPQWVHQLNRFHIAVINRHSLTWEWAPLQPPLPVQQVLALENLADNTERIMLEEEVVEVVLLVADISVVTLWLCLRPRRLQSLLSRNEPLLDFNSLFRELLELRQLMTRTALQQKKSHRLQPRLVPAKAHAAEAAGMDEARAWQSMAGVVRLCVVAALSNSLLCKLHLMPALQDRAMTSRDGEVRPDTTGNRRETLRVTGETNLKDKLRHKISRVPWAASKVNSSRVGSNPGTATADLSTSQSTQLAHSNMGVSLNSSKCQDR